MRPCLWWCLGTAPPYGCSGEQQKYNVVVKLTSRNHDCQASPCPRRSQPEPESHPTLAHGQALAAMRRAFGH